MKLFPTREAATADAERVASLLNGRPEIKIISRRGVGFVYAIKCAPLHVVCRGVDRYSVQYVTEKDDRHSHMEEFDAPTAEQALKECHAFLVARMYHVRSGLEAIR